jgi:excinuclease UvrABC nuclease subunit
MRAATASPALDQVAIGLEEALDLKVRDLLASLYQLLVSHPLTFDSPNVPELAGIYAIYDGGEYPCYIGQSRNLRRRLLVDHRKGNGKSSIFRRKLSRVRRLEDELAVTAYICQKCAFRILQLESERERLRLEHFATALLSPVLNGVMVDRIDQTISMRME